MNLLKKTKMTHQTPNQSLDTGQECLYDGKRVIVYSLEGTSARVRTKEGKIIPIWNSLELKPQTKGR